MATDIQLTYLEYAHRHQNREFLAMFSHMLLTLCEQRDFFTRLQSQIKALMTYGVSALLFFLL